MKAYKWSGSIAPLILNLNARWRWMVSLMPWLLYGPEKSAWCPWYRRLSGPQKWFESFGKGKNQLTLPGFEPHFIKLTAWPILLTTLSWMLFAPSNVQLGCDTCLLSTCFFSTTNQPFCRERVVGRTKMRGGVVWIQFTLCKYTTIWPAADHSECLRSKWLCNTVSTPQ